MYFGLHWVSDLVDECVIEDLTFRMYCTNEDILYVYLHGEEILREDTERLVIDLDDASFWTLLRKLL